MSNIIEFRNVTFSYRPRNVSSLRDWFVRHPKEKLRIIRAIQGISFRVRQGERFGIIGRNGAGKTTLCRLMGGALRPNTGLVSILPRQRAMLSGASIVDMNLTGYENVLLLSALWHPTEDPRRVADYVRRFSGLRNAFHRPMSTYSSGMQSRIAVSVRLFRPSPLLILDEAVPGADAEFVPRVRERLQTVIKNSGAVILVNHNLEELARVCDRVMLIEQGRRVCVSRPDQAIARYKQLLEERAQRKAMAFKEKKRTELSAPPSP